MLIFTNYLEPIVLQLASLLEYPNIEVRRSALIALFEVLKDNRANIHFDLQAVKIIAQNPLKEFLAEKDEYWQKRYLEIFTLSNL